jgi:L-fuconolactonase
VSGGALTGRIDAHVHVWDLARRDVPWIDESRNAIRRSFLVADWAAVAHPAGIDSAVLVQALNDADETDDLLAYAAAEPRIAGVIAWVDLTEPDVADRLAALREGPHGRPLVGIRHLALIDDDPAGWLCSPDVQRGLAAVGAAGLPYDLIFRPQHYDAVLHTVRAHADMTFVIDHLGKPPVPSAGLDHWSAGIRALAAEPNVTCKVSQIVTVEGDFRPHADIALAAFGADRVMFGSDWPVSLLAAPYADILGVAESLLATCSDDEQAQVMGKTAARIYALCSP